MNDGDHCTRADYRAQRSGAKLSAAGMDPLSWLAIPLLDIPVFAGLFGAALVHIATMIGGGFLIVSQIFRLAVWQTDWWLAFAGWSNAFMR